MSSYFDRVEQGMCEAVERRAHRPWYVRFLRGRRSRTLAVVLAALVIAAPAVGAVTNWYGFGSPDQFPPQSPTLSAGRALPTSSELLSLRVPDPQGGPPWGLRLVRTTRGDTCIQLGRVENGKLGSLGIDYAWNDDHQFHPFPNTSEGDDCGTTDAVGDGFLSVGGGAEIASANPTAGARGPQSRTCRPEPQLGNGGPLCPPGSTRMVFMGLLGPDAASITYEAPDGSLKTEKTSGKDGAYLLVFPLNAATCYLYTHGLSRSYGPCGAGEQMGASPRSPGAVTAVTYRDGQTCSVTNTKVLLAAQKALADKFKRNGFTSLTEFGPWFTLVAKYRLSSGLHRYRPEPCPPVGYVAQKQKPLTAAEVAAPISVETLPREYGEITVDITFKAREPVTSSSSWYEDYFTNPRGCPSSGQGGEVGLGNIRAGQVIHDTRLLGSCKGTYHGVIGYMQNSGPIDQNSSGGGIPGKDGSIVVGRFSFTIH